jgi:oligosaccharide repeat unit polymerase
VSLRRLNASVLSPLLVFPLVWAFAALLSQLHLLNGQDEWSRAMVAVVIAVPLAFVAGGVIGQAFATATTALASTRSDTRISERTFRLALVALVAIGLLELAHQFARAGAVPLLSGSIDAARFAQGGPTIILTDLLTVAAIVALTKPRDLLARESRFELGVAAVAIGAFGLQAGRGSVVLPIVVAIAARWLYWGRPNAYVLTGGGLIAVLAISLGFYLRVYQHPMTPFESELFGEVLPPLPFFIKPLIPVYLAITTNFLALEGIIGHFPTVQSFGDGAYSALALDNFISGARNVSDVSAYTTPPWVTSTVAGPLWADGGFAVVVPGVAVTGLLSAGAYAAAARTRSFRWSLVAAYLFFTAIFGLYTNLWTQHIDWLVVAPLLLVFGAFAERPEAPPGVVGRLWGKIRGMSEQRATAAAGNPDGARSRLPTGFRAAIVAGAAAIAILILAGLAIQATLPDPYPVLSTQRLPQSVADAEAVMTDGDHPGENSVVWWVDVKGDEVVLRGIDPSRPKEGFVAVNRFRLADAELASFDVGIWPPLRGTALFVFRQRGDNLETMVRDVETNRTVERRTSTVGPPLPGTTRDLAMATYDGGRRPDLFIVDRNRTQARVGVRIISGERGGQLLATTLPFRGLAPDEWSLDIGSVAAGTVDGESRSKVFRGDLALIQKDPDRAHANLKIMLGEDGYEGFAFQRDLDTSGDVAPSSVFMIGARAGATALYQIVPDAKGGPLLRVFSIEPPTGLL